MSPNAERLDVRRQTEESPGSIGQDAGENPRRGNPWQVQQRADRLSIRIKVRGNAERLDVRRGGKGERVR